MPNYHPAAKSLVHGLSDFWTMYFKELPIIEELYRGMEIEAGQAYLDLLSLLLTNSLQDTPLFDRQYFKLLRLREDAVTYAGDGRFGVALSPDVEHVNCLNNKVFGVTAALEPARDFDYDKTTRSLLFRRNPFARYNARTYDTVRVTARTPDVPIAVTFSDTGAPAPALTRSEYALTVTYDALVHTAGELAALLNTHTQSSGLVLAEPVGRADVPVVPSSGPLLRQETAPIQGFATRNYEVNFGTRFTDANVPSWLATDVQPGDVLRVLNGGGEYPISLVRDQSLLLFAQLAPEDTGPALEYAILRSPADDTSLEEPFPRPHATDVPAYDMAATVVGATRTVTFTAPTFPVHEFMVGDVLVLSGLANAGEYRVREVDVPGGAVVVDGPAMLDEANVPVQLLSVLRAWDVLGTGTLDGRVFTVPAAAFAADDGGKVLVLSSGRYVISRYVSSTELELELTPVPGAPPVSGLNWALATFDVTPTALYFDWPTAGTLALTGRRYVDNGALVEGIDYAISRDTNQVVQRTVWTASATQTANYSFRVPVHTSRLEILGGVDGTLLVAPDRFSAASVTFTSAHLGCVIRVENLQLRIDEVLSTTEVAVTALLGGVVSIPGGNGALPWSLESRAAAVMSEGTIETVTELGVWAPDVLIDRYHLYYTYGYMINRVQASSEAYRSLIRGIFQLFLLGPTLERFESAVNTVAGLAVIRDDGEIFLEYSTGALTSGVDGAFDAETRQFTTSATLTQADLTRRLFVLDGPNAGRTFFFAAILDANTAVLTEVPASATGASWEIADTGEHTIRTSRATYTLPRAAPVKPKYLDPAYVGTPLRAFQTLSAAFEVTDYVETPRWWEYVRIPEELAPQMSPERRQSTSVLFENVLGASDDPHLGDPGFYLGADTEGVTPTRTPLASGVDGAFFADPLYPFRNTEARFEAASAVFTVEDIGNVIVAGGVDYAITSWISSTAVGITPLVPVPFDGTPLVSWELVTGTLALRHKAAFVILDQYLKYHLFTVRFDAFLLSQLQSDVISDLQTLVFEAKPSYTYLILTSSLLFHDVARITEPEFGVRAALALGGQGGEAILANRDPLMLDGTWRLGSWFRYAEEVTSFTAPVGTLTDVLGAPDPGTERIVTKFYMNPVAYVHEGRARAYDRLRLRVSGPAVGGCDITVVDGEALLTIPGPPVLTGSVTMDYMAIPFPAVNAGTWRIGRVLDGNTAVLDIPSATPEVGVTVTYYRAGSREGRFSVDATGQSFFDAYLGFEFLPGDVYDPGSYIRRPYATDPLRQSYRFDERISATRARVATEHVYDTFTVDVSAYGVTFYDTYINDTMTLHERQVQDLATSQQVQYFVEILDGPNAGLRTQLLTYLSPVTATGSALLAADTGASARLVVRTHYTGPTEGGSWEQYVPEVVYNNHTMTPGTVLLPAVGSGLVHYAAYGIQRPLDPDVGAPDVSLGDTYYMLGGVNPGSIRGRTRTSLDPSLREDPVMIIRRTPPAPLVWYISEDGFGYYTESGYAMSPEDSVSPPIQQYYVTEDGFGYTTEDGFAMAPEDSIAQPMTLLTEGGDILTDEFGNVLETG